MRRNGPTWESKHSRCSETGLNFPVGVEQLRLTSAPPAPAKEQIRDRCSPSETRRRAAWADPGAWMPPAVQFNDKSATSDQ
jgi:hypothetical protein